MKVYLKIFRISVCKWLDYWGYGNDKEGFILAFFFLRSVIVAHNSSTVVVNSETLIQNILCVWMCSRVNLVHFVRTVSAEAHYLNWFLSHRGFMMCKTNLRQSISIYSVDFSVKHLEKIVLSKTYFKKKKVYLYRGFFPISRSYQKKIIECITRSARNFFM